MVLHEMRPCQAPSPTRPELAELVCSNSFRSDDWLNNAVGLLHEEMRRAGSLIMRAADAHKLPAGGALAVDRHGFSAAVTAALESHPQITIAREEMTGLPPADWDVIVATGPLTSDALAASIAAATGQDHLAFFDAIAPIVHRESIDFDIAWFQSRYDKEGPGGGVADYINLPLDEAQYKAFVAALLAGEKTDFKEWEKSTPYFEGLPAHRSDGGARRGDAALRADEAGGTDGPAHRLARPCRGATAPGQQPGHLWNMVGFQTKLKHAEQVRIFRTIPGLENAQFARLGGLHRNTFINSPRLLDAQLRLKSQPHLRFAGQVTGVEAASTVKAVA